MKSVKEYYEESNKAWGSNVRPLGSYQVVNEKSGSTINMHRGYCKKCNTLFQTEMSRGNIVKCLHCGLAYTVDIS